MTKVDSSDTAVRATPQTLAAVKGLHVVRLAGGRLSIRIRTRTVWVVGALTVFTLALAVLAVTLGEFPIAPGDVFAVFTGHGSASIQRIVLEWRAPRIVLAILAGAALALSGAIFQSLTRNPLGSPDILGFSHGAYTGALIVMFVIGGNYVATSIGAFVGGVATAAVVYFLSFRNGVQGFRLIVIGIAVSAFLVALNGWFIISVDVNSAISAATWATGSFDLSTWNDVLPVLGTIVVLVPVLAMYSQRLHTLELGDDAAIGLGVRAEPTRLVLLLVGVALVAVVTAAAGPISFVALAAPQIARRLTRSPGTALLPSALLGAALMLGSDVIAQRVIAPTQLPVGIITVIIGGIYLIALLAAQSRKA
ncbi:FecCD family ABC transporter permease [Subtercola boreus]|uniref:FecCD family ABC transporter permease n=1 Tax=Subtercola boreus TaxID=120213 RepID=UPI0011669A96|nr:iron chelate uptake ABC transporter family permease subunit [Subtercola boreus]TQL54428.1 iron complex transport system permease protein [Subtercola boreus]